MVWLLSIIIMIWLVSFLIFAFAGVWGLIHRGFHRWDCRHIDRQIEAHRRALGY